MEPEWRTYPLVVWFVNGLVEAGMVEDPMYPVNGIIGKEKEAARRISKRITRRVTHDPQWHREDQVRPSVFVDAVIESRVAHDFGLEPRQGEERHDWERPETRVDLELDLVFEEAGMPHHVVVEYEPVGETGEDKIEQVDSYEGDDAEREELPGNVVSWPGGESRPCRVENELVGQVEYEVHG